MPNQKSGKYKGVLFLRNIPPNLKDFFSAYCRKRGRTMSSMVIEFMETIVEIETSDRPKWVLRHSLDKLELALHKMGILVSLHVAGEDIIPRVPVIVERKDEK
jgi:hypothetical protein